MANIFVIPATLFCPENRQTGEAMKECKNCGKEIRDKGGVWLDLSGLLSVVCGKAQIWPNLHEPRG